jgi:hypothetical protein
MTTVLGFCRSGRSLALMFSHAFHSLNKSLAWSTQRRCLWLILFLLLQELPDSLKEQTHLKEWYIHSTLIQIIPTYIELFQAMKILDLPKNQITCLPAEIGRFLGRNQWSLLAASRQVIAK